MRIVVGVTTSTAARAALCWSYGFARRHDGVLTLVTAFSPIPPSVAWPGSVPLEPRVLRAAVEDTQTRVLREEIGPDADDARITRVVAPGAAGAVLCRVSRGRGPARGRPTRRGDASHPPAPRRLRRCDLHRRRVLPGGGDPGPGPRALAGRASHVNSPPRCPAREPPRPHRVHRHRARDPPEFVRRGFIVHDEHAHHRRSPGRDGGARGRRHRSVVRLRARSSRRARQREHRAAPARHRRVPHVRDRRARPRRRQRPRARRAQGASASPRPAPTRSSARCPVIGPPGCRARSR